MVLTMAFFLRLFATTLAFFVLGWYVGREVSRRKRTKAAAERRAAPKEAPEPRPAPKETPAKQAPKPTAQEPPRSPVGCPVPNCRIKIPHSHTEAFIKKLKER
jgi:hypothetical protein